MLIIIWVLWFTSQQISSVIFEEEINQGEELKRQLAGQIDEIEKEKEECMQKIEKHKKQQELLHKNIRKNRKQ